VIQTYQTDHYAIESSAKQSYEEFYDSEVMFRRVGAYPPFGHLLKILIECKNENRIEHFANGLAEYIRGAIDGDEFFEKTKVLGPEDDYPKKLNDIYRKTLYLKDRNYDRLIKAKRLISENWNQLDGANFVNIWFDYDPL
jgi:primosomal protein N' (replication factor Y)